MGVFFCLIVLVCNGLLCKAQDNFDNYEKIPENEWVIPDIVPGTKWCGRGNISNNYDDLGKYNETDKCCRTHDHCEILIEAGDTKYNLTNTADYTRLHCDCDEEFRHCLKKSKQPLSNLIGMVYFNFLHTMCFKKEWPVTGCDKWIYLPYKKCVQPKYDKMKEKIYQWFDVPNYGYENDTTLYGSC